MERQQLLQQLAHAHTHLPQIPIVVKGPSMTAVSQSASQSVSQSVSGLLGIWKEDRTIPKKDESYMYNVSYQLLSEGLITPLTRMEICKNL